MGARFAMVLGQLPSSAVHQRLLQRHLSKSGSGTIIAIGTGELGGRSGTPGTVSRMMIDVDGTRIDGTVDGRNGRAESRKKMMTCGIAGSITAARSLYRYNSFRDRLTKHH